MRDCSAVCARNASSRVYTVAHVSRVGRLRNQACSQLRCVHTDNASVITYRVLLRCLPQFAYFFFFPYTGTVSPVDYFQRRDEYLSSFFIFRWKKISRYIYLYTIDRFILCLIHEGKLWLELITVSINDYNILFMIT